MDHKEPLIYSKMEIAAPALCAHAIAQVIISQSSRAYWIQNIFC